MNSSQPSTLLCWSFKSSLVRQIVTESLNSNNILSLVHFRCHHFERHHARCLQTDARRRLLGTSCTISAIQFYRCKFLFINTQVNALVFTTFLCRKNSNCCSFDLSEVVCIEHTLKTRNIEVTESAITRHHLTGLCVLA